MLSDGILVGKGLTYLSVSFRMLLWEEKIDFSMFPFVMCELRHCDRVLFIPFLGKEEKKVHPCDEPPLLLNEF